MEEPDFEIVSNDAEKLLLVVSVGGAPMGSETRSSPTEHVVVHDPGVDHRTAWTCAHAIRSPEIQLQASSFARNVDGIQHTLSLPILLLSYYVIPCKLPGMYVQALNNVELTGQTMLSKGQVDRVVAEMERLRTDEMLRLADGTLVTEAATILQQMSQLEPVAAGIYALLSSCITAAWTAFECLVTDAWLASVNARAVPLGQRILESMPDDERVRDTGSQDGLMAKQIKVSLLAKYGFDLREHLGDLLLPKFDFTRPEGMKQAYCCAFGDWPELRSIFDAPDLRRLHLVRNLLVHRAGIIDTTYKERSGTTQEIGEQYPISGTSDVSKHANAVIEAACNLLEHIDRVLVSETAKAPPTP